MPLRIDPQTVARTIQFDGAVPIELSANAGGIVPLLTLGPTVRDTDGRALNALDGDQRLIACDASLAELAGTIFPGSKIVRIDPGPISGQAEAWESLDGWLTDQPLPVSMDAGALFAGGLTIAVRSDVRPAVNLPWEKSGPLWIARPIAPPVDALLGSAYLPTESWRLELSSVDRARLIAVTTLVSLISLAGVLYRGRGRSLVMLVTIGGCIVGVLIWRNRQNPVRHVGGSIFVERQQTEQNDRWTYWCATRPCPVQVDERPLPMDSAHADALGLREQVRADGSLQWRFQLKEGLTLATLRRETASLSVARDASRQDSPLRRLADAAYATPGTTVTVVHTVFGEHWPDVLVR